MRYFYIFVLTLILISCNDKKGYGNERVILGDRETEISVKKCVKVLQKGKVLNEYWKTRRSLGIFQ